MTAALALTMGEPAGVGGEITLKAWRARAADAVPPFFVIDDPARLAALARAIEVDVPVREIHDPGEAGHVFPNALPVLAQALPRPPILGRPDPANAPAVIAAIERAVTLVRSRRASAVVTNPVQKETLYDAGFAYPGHTEFLGALAHVEHPVMMLAGPELRVVPVTIHLSLADALAALSTAAIVTCGRVTAAALVRDFGIARPRLAVAALNPHAGEAGAMGHEERDIITPAVAALAAQGID
ncbi:MAG: 4-hydroxythreonine-4-phosphate dehydrogenase PdxA, partial [Stellaceae bacterium]